MTNPNPLFTPTAAAYAADLVAAGFTVYADQRPKQEGRSVRLTVGWFHYSRTVDGVERFGTYNDGSQSMNGPHHTMPLHPSRLNGSGALIGAQWGDQETLGLDNMPAESVEYATAVARAVNWCPVNAEPTPEAVNRARFGESLPQRYYRGATLANAEPWGIGTIYTPVTL